MALPHSLTASKDIAELHHVTDQTSRWLCEHLTLCEPWLASGGLSPAGVQALAELSLGSALALEWNAMTAPTAVVAPEVVRVWVDYCAFQLAQTSFADLPRLHPMLSTLLAAPYLNLRRAGIRLAAHEHTLWWLLDRGVLRAIEMVPYRALDREYTLFHAGVATEPDWRDLYGRTYLASRPDSLLTDTAATLSVTHTLFYLTDFGKAPLPEWVRGGRPDRLSLLLDSLLVHAWRLGDWDTVAELLLAMCVSGERGPLYYAGRSAFLERHRQDGGVLCEGTGPAGGLPGGEPGTVGGDGPNGCFHATFLSFLHCAVSLVQHMRPQD